MTKRSREQWDAVYALNQATWALNQAGVPGGASWRKVPPFEHAGVEVTAERPGQPYGRALAMQARKVHVPLVVLSGRRAGRLLRTGVIWACNGRSLNFELLDDLGDGDPCQRCAVASGCARAVVVGP